MDTQLRHSLTDGATHLRGRFKVTSADDVVSRAYLNLNTTRSSVHVDGYVRKFMSVHGSKQRLVDGRLRVGAGARCLFGSNMQVNHFACSESNSGSVRRCNLLRCAAGTNICWRHHEKRIPMAPWKPKELQAEAAMCMRLGCHEVQGVFCCCRQGFCLCRQC